MIRRHAHAVNRKRAVAHVDQRGRCIRTSLVRNYYAAIRCNTDRLGLMRQASGDLFPTDVPIPASQMIGREADVDEVTGALIGGDQPDPRRPAPNRQDERLRRGAEPSASGEGCYVASARPVPGRRCGGAGGDAGAGGDRQPLRRSPARAPRAGAGTRRAERRPGRGGAQAPEPAGRGGGGRADAGLGRGRSAAGARSRARAARTGRGRRRQADDPVLRRVPGARRRPASPTATPTR